VGAWIETHQEGATAAWQTHKNNTIAVFFTNCVPAIGSVALGVIRNVKKTSYTQLYEEQMEEQMANGKFKCVDDLLNSGDTWEVE